METTTSERPPSSSLLGLPAEIRINIIECLLRIPRLSTTSSPHRAAAYEKGFTSGVGHVTLVQAGSEWHSICIAGPPGFAFFGAGLLRACKSLHGEAMDILYSKILWVITMQNRRPIGHAITSGAEPPTIVAGPGKRSEFMQWITNLHIRQKIRPEEDLLQKAYALHSLMACLNPKRKTTDVALQFDSIHLVNDADWPKSVREDYSWQLYKSELARLDLGQHPQIRTSQSWNEQEDKKRLEDLAEFIGGVIDSPDFIYW